MKPFFLLLFLPYFSLAQNLVPNPSFEDTVGCPSSSNQVGNCANWMSFRDSPDYFNECSSASFCMVPNNYFGYQQAADGRAYCGLHTFELEEYREVIGVELIQQLNIGTTYYCSFYAARAQNLPGNGAYASNNLGMLFTNHQYSQFDRIPVTNYAHINYEQILIDTLNWTLITGSFIPDSAYQFLAIGNFFDYAQTDTLRINPNPVGYSAYYYIDEVHVGKDPITSNNTSLKTDEPYIYPNPASDYLIIKNRNIEKIEFYGNLGNYHTYEVYGKPQIDISKVPRGLYLCKALINNKTISTTILVIN